MQRENKQLLFKPNKKTMGGKTIVNRKPLVDPGNNLSRSFILASPYNWIMHTSNHNQQTSKLG